MNTELVEQLLATLEGWQKFNLDAKRPVLDKTSLEIQENASQSVKSRNALANESKNFKVAEDKGKLLPSLLKSYQTEIDNLTYRSKYAESAFLDLYKQLFEVNDPVSVLHAQCLYMKSTANLLGKNRQLEEKVSTLKTNETNTKALEEKIALLERSIPSKINEGMRDRERALLQELEGLRQGFEAREKDLENQLVEYRDKISILQHQVVDGEASSTSSFNPTVVEEKFSVLQSENDLLSEEVERLRMRVMTLEHQTERDREKLREVGSHASRTDEKEMNLKLAVHESLQAEYFQRGCLIEELKDKIVSLEAKVVEETSRYSDLVGKSNAVVREMENKVMKLQFDLEAAPKVSEVQKLKSQLRVFQAAEFNVSIDGDGGGLKGEGDIPVNEMVLLSKVRRLEAEIVNLKYSLKESQDEKQKSSSEILKNEECIADLRKLVLKLEDDLSRSQGGKDVAATALQNAVDHSSTITTSTSNGGAVMLQAVTEQRDRFRGRLLDCEGLNEKLTISVKDLNTELSALKADNVKLYEKIRYLSSYSTGQSSSSSGGVNGDIEGGTLSTEARYRHAYEQNVDPFAQFKSNEHKKQLEKLNVAERLTLKLSRFFLGNKHARMILFFYSFSLHLLVFVTMFHFTHTSHRD